MDPFLGQRVALGPRTGAIIDIRSPSDVSVHFDSGGVEDVDPNTLHYAHDDYPVLEEAIWGHPSPEKALDGDPYIHIRSRYRPRKKTATTSTSLPSSVTGDTGQIHTDNQALSGPALSIDFIPLEPGVMCSYCGHNQAECTVNQATLCLDCAEHRWGIPVPEVMADPNLPGEAPQEPSAATESSAEMEPNPEMVDAIERTGGLVDWLLGKVKPLAPGAPRFSHNWCRFRSVDRCWKSGVLDNAATQQMGYAVWQPRDMGPCGRATTAAQKACGHSDWGPGSEPGPGSNDPQSLTDATTAFSEGGQRNGTPGPVYRYAAMEYKPAHLQTPEEFANHPSTFWHGTPNGEIGKVVAAYGIHVGTHEAAKQALEARIGRRADGKDWDGTQEYGKTLLDQGEHRHHFNPQDRTWTEHVEHHEPVYPTEGASYSSGPRMSLTDKPNIVPLRITGPMTNTPQTPHEDFKANGYMRAQLTKGNAKSGYYYRNVGEDDGSISAVVPSRAHVKTHEDFKREAGVLHQASNDDHSRSAMVSLDLPPGIVDSTEDPTHITVVYLGKDLEGPRVEEIAARLQELAASTLGPLTGTVGGLGTFPPSASSDWKTPVYAIPQIEGINELRSHLEDLNASEHKEFSPHVTLKYCEPWDPMPIPSDPTPVSFTHLTLHNGDDVRHFPFAGKLGHLARFLTVDEARAAAPKVCPCGQGIEWDPIDGPQHLDGSVTHEDGDSVSDKVFHRSPEEIRDHRIALGDAWIDEMRREGAFLHEATQPYEGNHFFIFHKANPRSMGGSSSHQLEAWESDVPAAHIRPEDRKNRYLYETDNDNHDKHPVGFIAWNHASGRIRQVGVHPDHQRQGLATELLGRAKDIATKTRGVVPPQHDQNRTNEGDEWVKSLGGRAPARSRAFQNEFPAFRPHEASWHDVVQKAKRLRETNAVHILEVPTPQSPYVFSEIKGDTGTHHCFVAVKGGEQGQWSCSCPWGDYGPNGPLADDRKVERYRKTPCSHVLATRWELQSRSMFGRNPYTGALRDIWDGSPSKNGTHRVPIEVAKKWADPNVSRKALFDDKAEVPYMKNLMGSMGETGQKEPLLVQRNGNGSHTIIDGNHRLWAADALGMSHVDVNFHTPPGLKDQMKDEPFPEYKKQSCSMFGRSPYTGALHLAIQDEDEVPPKQGESPIPEGTIRLYHNTWESHVPSIREHGLLQSHAVGDSGKGHGNEPSAGIWAATHNPAGDREMEGPNPEGDRHTVEFWAHPHQVSHNAEHFWSEDPKTWAERGEHHVIMNEDIPTRQIVAIHAPWHTAYHQLTDDPRHLEEAKSGFHDSLIDDPNYGRTYGRAINKIKREGALSEGKPWDTVLTGDHKMWHVTRRGPDWQDYENNGFTPSRNGESGPGVYLTHDPAYADKMMGYDEPGKMHKLEVTVHAGDGLRLLDRSKPGGEEEYRKHQTDAIVDKRPLDQVLGEHGYHGVRYNSGGDWETVVHDPSKLSARYMGPKEASVDLLETWFEGRFLVEARGPMAPSQYIPINPGYISKSKVVNPKATHFEELPSGYQKTITDAVGEAHHDGPHEAQNGPEGTTGPVTHDGPLTHEMMVHHIMDMHDISVKQRGVAKAGRRWYKDAHNQAKSWAKDYGVSHRAACGVIAATSPGKQWGTNLSMSHYILKHLDKRADHKFNLTDETVDNLSRKVPKVTDKVPHPESDHQNATRVMAENGLTHGMAFKDMTDIQAHWALKLQSKHTDHLKQDFGGRLTEKPEDGVSWQSERDGTKAVRIARGEDPGDVLGGHKVRSFFNNMLMPGKTDDVTIDSHAASIAANGKMSSTSKTLKKILEANQRSGMNAKGGYAMVASAYREAHRRLQARDPGGDKPAMDAESTPADLQAITWKGWRNLNEGKQEGGKEGETPAGYKILSSYLGPADIPNNDDVEEDWNGLLDPMGGPDEPDPDLHRELGPGDDPDNVDDEDDEEDDDGLPKVGAMYDWTEMLRSARRERLAEQVVAPYQPPQVPVQYLTQQPHHLSSGYDEWGFEAPAVHQAGAVPSAQWQEEHSSEARNPGDTAPHDFGAPLDPNFRPSMLDRPYSDEKLLEPGGVATGGPFRSHMPAGYEVMTGSVHQSASDPPCKGCGKELDPMDAFPGGVCLDCYKKTDEANAPLSADGVSGMWGRSNMAARQPQVPAPVSRVAQVAPLPIPAGMSPEGASILAEHQAGLDYLRPPEGSPSGPPGASVGTGPVSREAALAQDQADKAQFASAAEQFLQTGSIAAPGMMINMDNIFSLPQGVIQREARSRDFTPSEQEEMVKEGELEGVRASNYGMLRLDGSMYEELERQLQVDEQSQSSAYDLFGG